MAKRKRAIPQYGTVVLNGIEYYRTRVEDSDGNRVALYAKTPEKLYDKELEALEQIDSTTFRRRSPTVAEYCEKWLLMQSVHVRATTLTDYTSKVRRHIIGGLGDKRMADVSLDDIQLALVPVSKKSASVYKSVVILCKSIFRAAKESHVIDEDPTIYLDAKGGVPQEERQALTDEQVERLLDTIRDLPPYVFVMIGLYAGLRREEILALQWDSVYLDAEAPYLTVRRAWHTEHNRPVILTELKTKAAQRNIPLPVCLVECLKEAKKKSTSDYVIANRDGDPLSYTQFKRLWQYIVTRTAKPRIARKLVDGKYVKYIYRQFLQGKSTNAIATMLTEEGIPTPGKKTVWQRATVESILRNEKYKGSALLQKSFTVDFLTKKTKVNEGEVPQYYVEDSHPAIIEPWEWEQVQVEMERRKNSRNRHHQTSPFSGKIICADCGGIFGTKTWHSTDRYRRVIWQCNDKFKGEHKCETPHLTEERLKELFLSALGAYLSDRETVITRLRDTQRVLTDTDFIDEDIRSLEENLTTITGKLRLCITENAANTVTEETYRTAHADLCRRFEETEARLTSLQKQRDRMKADAIAIGGMMFELGELDALPVDFDEKLWQGTIDHVTVHADERVVFRFKDGKEIATRL